MNNTAKSHYSRKKFTLPLNTPNLSRSSKSSEKKNFLKGNQPGGSKTRIEEQKKKLEKNQEKKEVKIKDLQYEELQKIINTKFKKNNNEGDFKNEEMYFHIKEKDIALKMICTCNWSGNQVLEDMRIYNEDKENTIIFSLNHLEFNLWIKGWKGSVSFFFNDF